jgi:hypothetical protein
MIRATLIAVAVLAGAPVHGQSQSDLARCLADNTSGKDRKELAKWVFLAMAAHPEIKPHASSDIDQVSERSQRFMAATLTRLVVEACPAQTKEAVKQGGAAAMETAFQALGQLAMQELMTNEKVRASMGGFEKYLDKNKLAQVFGPN